MRRRNVIAVLALLGGAALPTYAGNASAKFVSLRATATDSAGNAVVQTIVHGYGLRD